MKNKNIIGFFVMAFVLVFSAFYVLADDPEDHGTINLYHSIDEGLRVWGDAPDEADTAKIRACTTDVENSECNANDAYIIDEVPVTTGGANGNWYNSENDVSEWEPVKWNIYVTFYDDGHWMSGYNVAALFEDLYILYLQEQIDILKTKVSNLEVDVTINDANIWALYTDLGLLQSEIIALQSEVSDLNGDVEDLQSQIDSLNTRLSDIETVLDGMNQGDVNLVWDSSENRLRVKVNFPYGSTSAKIYAYDSTDSQKYGPVTVTPGSQGVADYDWDVSNWDVDVYNIKVNLLGNDGVDYYPWLSVVFEGIAVRDLQDRTSQLESDLDNLELAVQDNSDDIDMLNTEFNRIKFAVWFLYFRLNKLQSDVSGIESALESLIERVNSLEETLNAMNHGTINLRYKANLDLLEVWGESPEGATGVTLTIRSLDDYNDIVYSDTDSIINDGINDNRYAFNEYTGDSVDVSSFDPKSYNVQVDFNGLQGSYKVSQIFTNLELEGIQDSISILYNEVEDLWVAVDDNNDEIEWLWDDSDAQWNAIDALGEENSDQWRAIRRLWQQNFAQWRQINWLWQDSNRQWRAIHQLSNKVSRLMDKLTDMNHGTINLYHYENYGYKFLTVWGEAPEGSQIAHVEVYRLDQVPFLDTPVAEKHKGVSGNNVYNAFFNIEEWDLVKYNIYVHFSPAGNGCTPLSCSVGALFDDLFLQKIGDDLYGSGAACMELGIPIDPYDNEFFSIPREDTLLWLAYEASYYFDEEATFGDICAAYSEVGDLTYFLDWVPFDEITMGFVIDFLKCIGYDDETHLNTFINLCQEWEITNIENELDDIKQRVSDNEEDIQKLRMRLMMLRHRLTAFMQVTRQNFEEVWDELEHLWSLVYGFEHIDEKVWTTYYMSKSITRPIVYSVLTQESGLYTISLVEVGEGQQILSEGGISQILEDCVWLNAGEKNNIISYVTLDSLGQYNVQLRAEPGCGMDIDVAPPEEPGETIISNDFTIWVTDLRELMTSAVLEIASPETNFPEEGHQVESEETEIFWTRSDAKFDLTGLVYLHGWNVDTTGLTYCDLAETTKCPYVEGGIQTKGSCRRLLTLLPYAEDEEYGICEKKELSMNFLNLENRGFDEEGLYQLEIKLDVEPGPDPADYIWIGIDDTPPVINTYSPGEEDILSGPFTFSVGITDEMSGVRNVDLSLYLKGEEEPEWIKPAYLQGETWDVELNTGDIPDGSYDFKIEAWDYADNKVELTIDPTIDNTPPEMSEPQIGATVCIENHNLALSVKVIDVTSGVDATTVYAEVTGPDGTGIVGEVVTLSGGDKHTGTLTNENIVAGSYVVVFHASDKAGNPKSIEATQEVEMISCPAPPSTSSTGSSSSKKFNSESQEESSSSSCQENWDCDDWSECDSSEKQTRDCADMNSCGTIADKPAVVKSCTYFEEGSAEVGTEVEGGAEEGTGMGGVTGMATGMAVLKDIGKSKRTLAVILVLLGLCIVGYLTKDFWFKKK